MAQQEPMVAKLLEEYGEAKTARTQWRENMLKVYRLYRLYRPRKVYAWQANVVVPKTLEVIETNTAKLLKGLYSYKPMVNIYPTNEFEIQASVNAETVVNDRYASLEGVLFMYEWIKTTAMFGWAPVKSMYDAVLGTLVDELVDPFAFVPDPYATTRKMEYSYELRWVNLDYLKKMAQYGLYDGDKVAKLDKLMAETPAIERQKEIGRDGVARSTKVKLKDRWEGGNLKVIANDEYIIRDEDNVFAAAHGEHPYTFMHCTPVPLEFHSMGDGEVVRPSNEELNEIRNQRIDNLSLYMNQVLLVDDNKVEIGDPLWRPGKIIYGPTDAVKPLVQQNTSAAGIDMENIVREDAEAATGAYRYATGQAPSRSGETATGIISLQNKGNERYDAKLMLAGYSVAQLAQKHVRLLQAYMVQSFSSSERINGQWRFNSINKEALQGKFKFTAGVIAASEDRFLRRRDLLDMYREFKDRPDIVNLPALVKRIIETMDMPDTDELVITAGPPAPGQISPMLGQQQQFGPQNAGAMLQFPPAGVAPQQGPQQGGFDNVIPMVQPGTA